MSGMPGLPPKLHNKLHQLSTRIRRLRALQGSARLALLLTVSAFVAILLDSYFVFPTWVRCLLFLSWFGAAIYGFRKYLVQPLIEPLESAALASAVEEQYPRLNERLTTVVEITEHGDESNGSPEFMEEIIREASIRTKKLDFEVSLPKREVMGFVITSTIIVLLIFSPLFVVSGAGKQLQRFFLPWHTPKVEIFHRIVVTSGDAGVKRGESITLSGYVEPTKQGVIPPRGGFLLVKTGADKIEKIVMNTEQEHVYFSKRNSVDEDFEYAIEVGALTSDWHRVRAVDPINLLSAQTRIQPPQYVSKEEEKIEGLSELTVWQFSKITFHLQLDRTPTLAYLEWTPEKKELTKQEEEKAGSAVIKKLKIEVNEENIASITVPAKESGQFKLVLEGNQKVRTEFPPQPLHVKVDNPPKFEQVTGVNENSFELRPSEKLKITSAISDDLAVESVWLEYRVNVGEIHRIPLQLQAKGTSRTNGVAEVDFSNQAKEGEIIEYRLVATDNRSIPEAKLEPQTTYYPADERWASLVLKKGAPSLKQQEILAKKKEIQARLETLISELKAEQRATYKLNAESLRQPILSGQQKDRLNDLRAEVHDTKGKTDEFAKELQISPELNSLTQKLRAVSEGEMTEAESLLAQSQSERQSSLRTKQFDGAEENLAKSVEKLQDLLRESDKIAKQRLNQLELENLANEQKRLQEEAAKADPKDLPKLAERQKEIEEELKKLIEKDEELRKAVEESSAEEMKKLGEQIRELAQQQRRLADSMNSTNRESSQAKLGDLIARQKQLLEKVDRLSKKSKQATRLSKIAQLSKAPTEQAKNDLEKDNLPDALKNQELSARELERLATELDRAWQKAKDPKVAMRQIAEWQRDLSARIQQEKQNASGNGLSPEKTNEFQEEQDQLRKAIESVKLPNDLTSRALQSSATQSSKESSKSIGENRLDLAQRQMTETEQSLELLAQTLPTLEKRLAQAKQEVTQLRQQQEALSKQVESLAKQFEKLDPKNNATQTEIANKLADLLKKQDQIGEKLSKIDTPTKEPRREKTTEAIQEASNAMKQGRGMDLSGTQQGARRELDRLEQSLGGFTTPDEKIDQLLRRQEDITKQTQESIKDSGKSKGLHLKQQELNRELQGLQASEAPHRLGEALDAVKRAESALDFNPKPEEAVQATQDAVQALQKLSDAMNNRETDAERLERLAKKQKSQSDDAEKLSKKPLSSPEQQEVRRRSQQLAEELKQIPTEKWQPEKQKALQSLNQAQQSNSPIQHAKNQQLAAEAVQDFAEKLKREQVEKTPTPNQLARAQRDLMNQLNENLKKADQLPKQDNLKAREEALQKAVEKQRELTQQAEKIASGNPNSTIEAMKEAEKALTSKDASKALEKQKDALQDLEKSREESTQLQPTQLPNRQDVDSARKLAKEQRDLKNELAKAQEELVRDNQPSKDNPLGELAKLQEQIAKQTEKLAQSQKQTPESKPQADQAAQSTRQASEQLKNSELKQAHQSGQSSASQLQKLAQSLQEEALSKEANQLATQQEALNKKLEPLLGKASAQRAQQQSRQKDLQRQAEKLNQSLESMNQKLQPNSSAQSQGQAADKELQSARREMQNAQEQSQKGRPNATQEAQNRAAKSLDQAAQQTMNLASQMVGKSSNPNNPKVGESLKQAQQSMNQAHQELQQGNKAPAENSMQQAGDSLANASQQLGQPNPGSNNSQPGGNNPGGTQSGSNAGNLQGTPDLKQFGPEAEKYAGKPWGELPGELKTKILQDLKNRYGDDYARNIKLYFESIAERK